MCVSGRVIYRSSIGHHVHPDVSGPSLRHLLRCSNAHWSPKVSWKVRSMWWCCFSMIYPPLKLTAHSPPWKMVGFPSSESPKFQGYMFRGELLVSGRVSRWKWGYLWCFINLTKTWHHEKKTSPPYLTSFCGDMWTRFVTTISARFIWMYGKKSLWVEPNTSKADFTIGLTFWLHTHLNSCQKSIPMNHYSRNLATIREVESDTVLQQTSLEGTSFPLPCKLEEGTNSFVVHHLPCDLDWKYSASSRCHHPHLSPDLYHTNCFSTLVTYLVNK